MRNASSFTHATSPYMSSLGGSDSGLQDETLALSGPAMHELMVGIASTCKSSRVLEGNRSRMWPHLSCGEPKIALASSLQSYILSKYSPLIVSVIEPFTSRIRSRYSALIESTIVDTDGKGIGTSISQGITCASNVAVCVLAASADLGRKWRHFM